MHFDRFIALAIVFPFALITACQVGPTPTLAPFPTATFIPTDTPEAAATETIEPTPVPTSGPVRAVVTDTLRVREQPATTSRILGRLKKDTVVSLLARKDDNEWFQIQYPPDSGEFGWISAEIVVPEATTDFLPIGSTSSPPPPGSIFARVQHNINVRAGPSREFDVITTIPANARVTVIGRLADGEWYRIRISDTRRIGWVLAEFLEFQSPPDQLALAPVPPLPTPGPTPVPRPTRALAIAASPTGRILTSSNREGAYDIYSVADNGVVRGRLTQLGNAFGARYSPDGSKIAFYRVVSTAPVVVSHIYVANADGSNPRDVSRAGASDSDPDWSPDGKQIAFVRTPRASAPEIWVMNANGSGARRVITLSVTTGIVGPILSEFSPFPRWSPDGGRIAYAAVPRSKNFGVPLYPNIFVVNVNGSGEIQLTDNDLINSFPLWSPDGKQIAWSVKDFINRQNWRVMIMSAGGGSQRPLIPGLFSDTNNGVQAVKWLGNQLLLAGWTGSWNVYIANADGSGVSALTQEAADLKPTDFLP